MSESDLKRAVLAALHAMGVRCDGNAQGGTRRFKTGLGVGSADIIGCVRMRGEADYMLGRFFAIELKTPHGKTSKARAALQAAWRAERNVDGGYCCVATSVAEAVEHAQRAQRGERV